MSYHYVPSGKRLHNYRKSPFSMGKSTISMVIFNSYVSLPEGMFINHGYPHSPSALHRPSFFLSASFTVLALREDHLARPGADTSRTPSGGCDCDFG